MLRLFKNWTYNLVKHHQYIMKESVLIPPSTVRGMKELDRTAFEKKVTLPGLLVPVESIKECKKLFRAFLPNLHMKLVIDNPNNDDNRKKVMLLNPDVKDDLLDKEKLEKLGVQNEILHKEITIGYENFKPRDIFQAVLPAENEENPSISPASYSQIGHIIQLNLREHQLPYKKIIGEVFLDKIPSARTVVNKVETITSEYRNLDMELLAGEKDFFTRVLEHNRKFELDFSKVFWNSRLSTEHNKIASIIPDTDVVFDACAGIGPFSIPLGKKGCQVYANDLNPDCHHWLLHNMKLNKVKTMECFNIDGRDFVKEVLGKYLTETEFKDESTVHVIMNLPGIAVEFLDAFPSLLEAQREIPSVKVYFYIFASKIPADAKDEINARVTKHLGHPLPDEADIRRVRDVAPSKDQYCVSFVVSKDILFKAASEGDSGEPAAKKLKATTS